jgi:hypothetical protein
MPWPWWRLGLFFVWVALFSYLRGRLDSVEGWMDYGLTVAIVAPIILVFWYLLDRVWKRRSGLGVDDEE